MEVLLGIAVVAALVAGSFFVGRYLHRRRIAELSAWAKANGWSYAETGPELVGRYIGEPFGRGFARRVQHVLTTTIDGRPVQAFDYSFKERQGSGKEQRTVTYSYAVVATTTPVARPTLQVTTENIGTRLLNAIGLDDLQLESEDFNRTFRVSAEDAKFAYDVLHPRTMEWMLADPRARELNFRFERADLLSWERGRLRPERAAWAAGYLIELLDRVPAFVWKDR